MAYFFNTDNSPGYLTVIVDRDKTQAASTETFEEYAVTNRFNFGLDRVRLYDVVSHSVIYGYPANVKCLYYYSIVKKNIEKMITKDKFLKYDGLPTAGLMVPMMKERVAEVFKQYCGDKVQILDVVIRLQDGEELHDYKVLNVLNRVEAFTWEGSERGIYYEDYHSPHALSMRVMAYKKEIIEREIICRDSITNIPTAMICDGLANELRRSKFKGFRFNQDAGSIKIV